MLLQQTAACGGKSGKLKNILLQCFPVIQGFHEEDERILDVGDSLEGKSCLSFVFPDSSETVIELVNLFRRKKTYAVSGEDNSTRRAEAWVHLQKNLGYHDLILYRIPDRERLSQGYVWLVFRWKSPEARALFEAGRVPFSRMGKSLADHIMQRALDCQAAKKTPASSRPKKPVGGLLPAAAAAVAAGAESPTPWPASSEDHDDDEDQNDDQNDDDDDENENGHPVLAAPQPVRNLGAKRVTPMHPMPSNRDALLPRSKVESFDNNSDSGLWMFAQIAIQELQRD